MRGRYPDGREYVDKLEGSAQTKERLKVILDTMWGQTRLLEACQLLGIGETRFHQLRQRALQAALEAIEPRAAGRPGREVTAVAARLEELEQALAEKELALQEAQVREEVALILPYVDKGTEKKNAPVEPTAPQAETEVNVADAPTPTSATELFEDHMEMMTALVELQQGDEVGQQRRRELEQCVRQRVVAFTAQLRQRGHVSEEVARRLGLSERTLRHWEHDLQGSRVAPAMLGRPRVDSGADQQQAVLGWLEEIGPGVGVPTLRTQFPNLPRVELTELLKCYRNLWRTEHSQLLHVLHWRRPGTVWAMDFAEAPLLIDGSYPYLLAVRDLASGQQLLWRPVRAATAAAVIAELTPLFMASGAPWVLKMDNGPAFLAAATQHFLQRWETISLFSPVRRPSYNGSIEAAIGSLKNRTRNLAALWADPDVWTSALVEDARQQANTTARPRRLHGLTPAEVWNARPRLRAEERERFRDTVIQLQVEARAEQGLSLTEDLNCTEQAAVNRKAISRALVAHDLLLYRRRRIPAPINRLKTATKG